MAATQVKTNAPHVTEDGVIYVDKSEWLIQSAEDLAEIPPVAPGSVAYKPDASLIYIYDGTTWVQWGGVSGGNG